MTTQQLKSFENSGGAGSNVVGISYPPCPNVPLIRQWGAGNVCTAIPYREITGFLQGFPCVVIPPLHALAVYRV